MAHDLVFRGARVVTCDRAGTVIDADVAVDGERIAALGEGLEGDAVVDARGTWLLPGFVQAHVHLVQALFRDLADDLDLLPWLRTRLWPLERAHDRDSAYDSARVGLDELLAGGTTAILDMATVSQTDAVFEAARQSGIRYAGGMAQMDRDNEAGLGQDTDTSLRDACDLADRWHGRDRLRYAFAPRFVPSCTDRLLRETAAEARGRGCMLHTHASENRDEVALVGRLTGMDNVAYLAEVGLSGPDVALAHCIHVTGAEVAMLAAAGTRVVHCPSSNFKLGSGIARVPELLAAGVHVSLGADGAPCNNRMDMFAEMRLAALAQAVVVGPGSLPARTVLRMATRGGAEALGLDSGEIAPGRLADIVLLDPSASFSGGDEAAAIVYSLDPRSVVGTWIGGRQVASRGRARAWDREEVHRSARASLARVRGRAGV